MISLSALEGGFFFLCMGSPVYFKCSPLCGAWIICTILGVIQPISDSYQGLVGVLDGCWWACGLIPLRFIAPLLLCFLFHCFFCRSHILYYGDVMQRSGISLGTNPLIEVRRMCIEILEIIMMAPDFLFM
jgi:hypothetical protein